MNLKRRNFLKLALFGSGAFLAGGLLGRFGLNSSGGKEFKNFKVVEEKDKLVFYNKNGQKVMALSDDGLEVE